MELDDMMQWYGRPHDIHTTIPASQYYSMQTGTKSLSTDAYNNSRWIPCQDGLSQAPIANASLGPLLTIVYRLTVFTSAQSSLDFHLFNPPSPEQTPSVLEVVARDCSWLLARIPPYSITDTNNRWICCPGLAASCSLGCLGFF